MSNVLDEKDVDLTAEKQSYKADDTSREENEEEATETTTRNPDETANELDQTRSRKSEIDPFSTPPDGGLNAWLKVLGCFLIYSNIWYSNDYTASKLLSNM